MYICGMFGMENSKEEIFHEMRVSGLGLGLDLDSNQFSLTSSVSQIGEWEKFMGLA